MMGQEYHHPKSVMDAYNLMLHFKEDTGQTHQNRTVSANRTTQMTFNKHEKEVNDGEGTRRDLKDFLCYKCSQYCHYADQCGLSDNKERK